MTTHVVLFRFHEPADAEEAAHRLGAMAGRIPGLTGVRVGMDHNGGPNAYHLVLVTEHESRAALTDYANHPAHHDVLAWLGDRISERAVVDTDDF
jgi:heme-degrading monooxygenase HmoA